MDPRTFGQNETVGIQLSTDIGATRSNILYRRRCGVIIVLFETMLVIRHVIQYDVTYYPSQRPPLQKGA